MNHENVCVLISGGLDSAVALAETVRRPGDGVLPLYIRSELVWERSEMYWLERLLQTFDSARIKPMVSLRLPVGDLYGDHWSTTSVGAPDEETPDEAVYLPGRNILLLAKAGVLAADRGCGAIVLGSLAGNPFPDATQAFFQAMGAALGRGMGLDRPLEIDTPLAGMTKHEVVTLGHRLGVPLQLTFSCIHPTHDHRHCGTCNKCAERKRGFAEAGVEDPTDYA